MRIKTTTTAVEQLIPPRCRKPRSHDVEYQLSGTIREISKDDAPIALREHGFYGEEPDGLFHGEGWQDYRWYNGQLYVRRTADDECCRAKGWYTVEPLVKKYSRPFWYWDHGADIKKIRKAFHAELARYLIIGDEVWYKKGEPRYVIATFGLGHNHASTNLMIDHYFNDNIRKNWYFNALQFENAVNAAKKVALGRGDTKSVDSIGEFWKIEVLLPEAVKVKANITPDKNKGGDKFMNALEGITSAAGSAMEAGLLAIAFTGMEMNK